MCADCSMFNGEENQLTMEDALELSAQIKSRQTTTSYVMSLTFSEINQKGNLMPVINVVRLDSVLQSRSVNTTSNPAADGQFNFFNF